MLQDTQTLCYRNHHGIAQLAKGVAELRRGNEGEKGALPFICNEHDIELS